MPKRCVALHRPVGMFQGGVQALSRSYFTKIIPANQSGEFFGLMDICGKGASFMGTTIVSLISQLTGNINIGVGMIAVLVRDRNYFIPESGSARIKIKDTIDL